MGEFTEIETGKGADALDRQPQLAAALARFAGNVLPVMKEIRAAGAPATGRSPPPLNARSIHTARGGSRLWPENQACRPKKADTAGPGAH